MMGQDLVHPYIQSITVLCDIHHQNVGRQNDLHSHSTKGSREANIMSVKGIVAILYIIV